VSCFPVDIVPRIWNFTLLQSVVVPLFTLGTFESVVGQRFFLCEADEIPGDAFLNRTSARYLNQQHFPFDRNTRFSHSRILQRPFLVDELDMDAGYSVCTRAAIADCGKQSHPILGAGKLNDATDRNLQRRK